MVFGFCYFSERMSVDESLKHPWLATTSDIKLDTEKLKQFYEADKEKVCSII